MGVIYKATCSITGKSYIGQTVRTLETRQKEHLKAKDDYAFHRALRKHKPESFVWSILENCDDATLGDKEKYWISFYDTFRNGYNETEGGDDASALIAWQLDNPDKVLENAKNGLKYANEWRRQHPEEALKQTLEAQKLGAQATKKKVRCIDLDLEFDGLSDAERWSKSSKNPNGKPANHQHISKVCKGQRKTCGGYRWEYI